MIAVDTSSLAAYFSDLSGRDIDLIDFALEQEYICLPAPVLCEILSDPKLPESIEDNIKKFPVLQIHDGYWERAGELRRIILSKKLKARLADALIAQTCIDHKIALITRDADFTHFVKYGGLKLAP